MINIPKGTKDMLPADSYKWQFVERCAREVARLFNILQIRTPVFEQTELFLRGVGETTDIVNKEMYTFTDKGGRSMTLKPEGTAGVVRSFIESGMANGPLPIKMYYFTPVFRYEQPQAGRLREHHQFGIEVFGSADASADAELILAADAFFKKLPVRNLKVNINSIGCQKCRPAYNEALVEYLQANSKDLCNTCNERIHKNPLRVLDCKVPQCKKVIAGAPRTIDYLCGECDTHFTKLKQLLDIAKINYQVNPLIVRGLDYYTKTVFEFISEHLGAQSTVCGGGRYDTLIEELGGKSVPAVGFGLGIERLLLMLENMQVPIYKPNYVDVYLASAGQENYDFCFQLAIKLRAEGISVVTDNAGRSLKAQFKYADRIGAQFTVVLGSDEIASGKAKVKNMFYSSEDSVDLSLLTEYIKGNKE